MSSSKLKPKLNTEILYGILQEFGDGKEETSRELIKSMLAGREPYRAFLDYFSKATRVSFRVQTLEIVVMNKIHCFGYDWEHLNLVLNVAIPSINHLSIFECPGNESGFGILDRFLKPDLTHLTLFAPIPSRYMDFFKDNCNFESVHSRNIQPQNPSVLDVFKIPSEEHKVVFASYMDYIRAVPFLSDRQSIADAGVGNNNMKFVPNETFPAVKKLVLDPCNYVDGFASEILLFPNLQSVNAEFLSEGTWQNSINKLINFPPLNTPSGVKANISFIVYDGNGRLEEVLHLKKTNPEIIFNEHDATISKMCKVQNDGYVNFVIKFGGLYHEVAGGQNMFPGGWLHLIERARFVFTDVALILLLCINYGCRIFGISGFINWITGKYFDYAFLNNDSYFWWSMILPMFYIFLRLHQNAPHLFFNMSRLMFILLLSIIPFGALAILALICYFSPDQCFYHF